MLISHKYKFIFIKTKKTAGTSIEIELNKIMSETDVVTPIKPGHPDHKPRNYVYGNKKLFNHIMIKDLEKIIPKNIYQNYFKFCVEREPVEKCLSDFCMQKNSEYHNKNKENLSWKEYLKIGNFPIDTEKYTDNKNNLCVDRVLKYEKLEDELYEISKILKFDFKGLKIKAKSGFREKIYVSEKEKKLIYKAFLNSNKFTGY